MVVSSVAWSCNWRESDSLCFSCSSREREEGSVEAGGVRGGGVRGEG